MNHWTWDRSFKVTKSEVQNKKGWRKLKRADGTLSSGQIYALLESQKEREKGS